MPFRLTRPARVLGYVLLACSPAHCSPTATPGRAPAPDTVASTPPGGTAGAPRDSVTLRTDRLLYRAGDAVSLTIENRTGVAYTFNPCLRQVERQEAVGWTRLEEDRACTMEARLLGPGATRTAETSLPGELAPGKYRLVLELRPENRAGGRGRPALATSAPLTVEP